MFHRRGHTGFSLMELLISLAIIAILGGAATITLMGYIPKSRLNDTARQIELTMQRAQSESQARGLLTGVQFWKDASGECYWRMCIDDFTTSDSSNSPDGIIDTGNNEDSCARVQACKKRVDILRDDQCTGLFSSMIDATNNMASTNDDSLVYFKPSGEIFKNNSGTIQPADWQIWLRSKDLDESANELTVELLRTGLINMPKRNKEGYLTGTADVECQGSE